MGRIGLFGGTFDPPHTGHIELAKTVLDRFSLDKIIFIPAGNPPHKQAGNITQKEHRYNMTALLIKGFDEFLISDFDIKNNSPNYSYITIEHFKKTFSGDEIFFIVGGDSYQDFPKWKNYPDLLSATPFIVVAREGIDVFSCLRKYKAEAPSHKAYILDDFSYDLSSSELRSKLASGHCTNGITDDVSDYINKHKLYKRNAMTPDEIKQKLKTMLTSHRYIHSLGVTETATKMAETFGQNVEKAEIAALLHDCAKQIPYDEQYALCEEFNIELDDFTKAQPGLMHAELGACLAERDFGICDEEIKRAIRYHTLGRKEMSTLEKIIYLSDIIEPNRQAFDGLSELRELCFSDLDKALVLGLKLSLAHVIKKGVPPHPQTIKTYEYVKSNIRRKKLDYRKFFEKSIFGRKGFR